MTLFDFTKAVDSAPAEDVDELSRRLEAAERDRDRALELAGLRLATIVELRAQLRGRAQP